MRRLAESRLIMTAPKLRTAMVMSGGSTCCNDCGDTMDKPKIMAAKSRHTHVEGRVRQRSTYDVHSAAASQPISISGITSNIPPTIFEELP